MLGRLVRRLALLAAAAGIVRVAWGYGRTQGALALAGILAAFGAVTIWLPRAAHAAFRRGDFGRAGLYYSMLRWLMPDASARAAAALSVAACQLGAEAPLQALRGLERVPVARLTEAARCAWLNNVAYARARDAADAADALERIDEAIALRPSVPGFRHTRGVALLSLGRVDDAIRELDSVWRASGGADPSPLLEAERCYDLGMAWRRKGEAEYARDYFERALRAAPESSWAARSASELGYRELPTGAVLPESA